MSHNEQKEFSFSEQLTLVIKNPQQRLCDIVGKWILTRLLKQPETNSYLVEKGVFKGCITFTSTEYYKELPFYNIHHLCSVINTLDERIVSIVRWKEDFDMSGGGENVLNVYCFKENESESKSDNESAFEKFKNLRQKFIEENKRNY
jgi:hypothetical protein